MGNKHSVDGLIKFLYVFYVIFFLNTTISAIESGIIDGSNWMFGIFENVKIEIGGDLSIFAFYAIFLMFIFFAIKSELNSIVIYDDIDKKYKLSKKLIPYKVLVALTLVYSLYIIVFSKHQILILSGIFLTIVSVMIHFGKYVYYTAFIYDRKLEWLKTTNSDSMCNYDSITDTKKWRYKYWFNNREKVMLKYRKNIMLSSIPGSIFFALLLFLSDSFLFKLIWGYYFLCNLFSLLESILGLYTSISGVCTGVIEKSRRNSQPYYNIVITDYKNKRELKIRVEDFYNIEVMNNLTVVHGMFSKKLISINLIPEKTYPVKSMLFYVILVLMILYSGYDISNHTNISSSPVLDYEEDSEEYLKEEVNNIKEQLVKEEKNYEKIIEINKEKIFNDITIKLEKLYLSKKGSKFQFMIHNNSDKGLVLNANYNTHISNVNGIKNSNILLPQETYVCELDFFEEYDIKKSKYLSIDLEYTLSEHIIFDNEYMDYNYSNYYNLNVIDNHCLVNVDLKSDNVEMKVEEYNQFYNVSQEIIKFK